MPPQINNKKFSGPGLATFWCHPGESTPISLTLTIVIVKASGTRSALEDATWYSYRHAQGSYHPVL
jgi:hypothetical protein